MTNGVTLQQRISAALEVLPANEYGWPEGLTHRELARAMYRVEEPTASQLSSIRRAAARLVRAGVVDRDTDRRAFSWAHKAGRHERIRAWSGEPYRCRNPAGVVLRRKRTITERRKGAGRLAELEATIGMGARNGT